MVSGSTTGNLDFNSDLCVCVCAFLRKEKPGKIQSQGLINYIFFFFLNLESTSQGACPRGMFRESLSSLVLGEKPCHFLLPSRQAGSSGSSQIPGSDTQLHGQGNKERNSGFPGRCADPRGDAAPWQSKEQELLVGSPSLPRTGEGSGELVVFGRKGGLCEKCN